MTKRIFEVLVYEFHSVIHSDAGLLTSEGLNKAIEIGFECGFESHPFDFRRECHLILEIKDKTRRRVAIRSRMPS